MALNKSELVEAVAKKTGESQAAVNRVVDALFETIAHEVGKGGKVTIPGWLSVDKGHRAARTGRNPQTGKTIKIAAKKVAKFKAGAGLAKTVNK